MGRSGSTWTLVPTGGPTLHEVSAFVVLAEDLHFGRAARRLGVAQPSLSQAIRRLEAKLDVVLFERTSRRVSLTAAGAELLPCARDVLADVTAMHEVAAVSKRLPSNAPGGRPWSGVA